MRVWHGIEGRLAVDESGRCAAVMRASAGEAAAAHAGWSRAATGRSCGSVREGLGRCAWAVGWLYRNGAAVFSIGGGQGTDEMAY